MLKTFWPRFAESMQLEHGAQRPEEVTDCTDTFHKLLE